MTDASAALLDLALVGQGEPMLVEGVNLIKRHTRPNPQRNVKGGIVEREASVHASNVQLVCPECSTQTRIGRKVLADGRILAVGSALGPGGLAQDLLEPLGVTRLPSITAGGGH